MNNLSQKSLNLFQLIALWLTLLVTSMVIYRFLTPLDITTTEWKPLPYPTDKIWQPNNQLKTIEIEHKHLPLLDSIAIDSVGKRYAALKDGRIMHWYQGNDASLFIQLQGNPAGISFDLFDNLYVVTESTGDLIKIDENKNVFRLKSFSVKNNEKKHLNDVAIASNGNIFATQSTKKWSIAESNKAGVEHHNDGVIHFWKNDSATPKTFYENLSFPNGIVMSHDEKSVLVAETLEYKISRIWLTKENYGKKEILIENLPGYPGDLAVSADGKSYWCTMFETRKNLPLLDKIISSKFLKNIFLRMPSNWLPKPRGTPFVFRFNDDGKVLQTLQSTQDTLPGFSSVIETKNTLLLNTLSSVGNKKTPFPVYRFSIKGL